MSEWHVFINKSGSSNKYWKYKIDNNKVEKAWGRIGGNESVQIKDLGSVVAAHAYANREATKKISKGYIKSNGDHFAEEDQIAKALGFRWKINIIEFLNGSLDSGKIKLSDVYNPIYGVFVELQNSWTKEKAYVVLNHQYAVKYLHGNIADDHVFVMSPQYCPNDFIDGIRKAIRNLAAAVKAAIKFGAVGARVLDIDGLDGEIDVESDIAAVINQTGASKQAVIKFAAIGTRILEI